MAWRTQVEPDLAGEKVILWWGLFDSELYVEHQEHRYGQRCTHRKTHTPS